MTILRPHRKDAPSVELIDYDGVPAVVKSYRQCNWISRNLVGPLALSIEEWALTKMASSSHSPRLISRPHRHTIISEFIDGTPLEEVNPAEIDVSHLRGQAESLLFDLNQAGVAHGDLGHDHWQTMGRECNLIYTKDRRLVAIDFAGSLPTRTRVGPLRSVARAFQAHDRLLLDKIAFHFQTEPVHRAQSLDWPPGLWEFLRLLKKI